MAAFAPIPAPPAPASDAPGTQLGLAERACAALLAPLVAIGLAALARSLSLFLQLMEQWRAGTLPPMPATSPAAPHPAQSAVPAAAPRSRFAWILALFRRSPAPALQSSGRARAAASPRARGASPRLARAAWATAPAASAPEMAPQPAPATPAAVPAVPWPARPVWPPVPCPYRARPYRPRLGPYARAGPGSASPSALAGPRAPIP